VLDLTISDNRGIGIALSAVHEQLCVVADLLRANGGRVGVLEKRVNRMAQAVGE